MAARRKRRGQRRNRGRFGFLYKLLCFVLILAAIFVGCAVFFRVDEIEVSGQRRYTREQIVQAAGVELQDNLFLLNKFRINAQIRAQLPYVDDLSIYRRWPDTLVIEVTESERAAVLRSADAWWIVDARGKILERCDTATEAGGLPEISGLTPVAPTVGAKLSVASEQELKLQSLVELLTALDHRGMMGGVGSIDLSAVNEITLEYLGRYTVRLPMSGSDLNRLLRAVDGTVRDNLDETAQGVLDLTVEENKVHFIPNSG